MRDFEWTAEQRQLRLEARELAHDAVARYGRHNDSSINGYSKAFAKEIARRGWIDLTWPKEHGGQGRSAVDRLIIAEELIVAMWLPIARSGRRRLRFRRTFRQDRCVIHSLPACRIADRQTGCGQRTD